MNTKILYSFLFASVVLLLGAIPMAKATPTISIAVDGGTAFICADGDPSCDVPAAADGAVQVQSAPGFVVNFTNGVTKPLISSPLMGFNSVSFLAPTTTAEPLHTLVLKFSETGFTGLGNIGGSFVNFGNFVSIVSTAFIGTGNNLFEETLEIASMTNSVGSFGDVPVNFETPYSLTQIVTITILEGMQTSFDFRLTQQTVPEPKALFLLGLGLASLAASRRWWQVG